MNDINKFFLPKRIAIIGASDHEEKVGGILMKRAVLSKGEIIPINPSHTELFGKKCYKSVMDFKDSIDLAVIAIPSQYVASSLEECGKRGIKNVIIITAGFSEIGKVEEENKIREIANKYGIRFIGPNCFGIFSSELNLDLTFSWSIPKKGSIVFISQSGALWSYMSDKFKHTGFAGFAGLGNQGDLEFSDFIEYFSNDKNTKSIVLYVEKFKDGRRFIEVCKNCISHGKKIYAVKAGKSEEGSKAAFSHTGSLATDYEIYRGAFKQAGVNLCSSLEEAMQLASGKEFDINKKAKLNIKDVEIITNAGGAGALASDYLAEKGIKVLSDRDVLGTALASDYLKALNEIKTKNVLLILTPQSMSEIDKTAEAICKVKEESSKNIVALFLGAESMTKANSLFEKNNIVYFNDFVSFSSSL